MKIASPSDLKKRVLDEQDGGTKEEGPSPFHSFEIDETIRGVRYEGRFSFKVPTLGEQVVIGSMKSRYLPHGAVADPNAAAIVEQMCYLEVTLQEKPTWWQPLDFLEADLLAKVYAEVIAYANKFLGRGAISGAASPGNEEQDNGGDDVDGQDAVGEGSRPPGQRPKVIVSHSKGSGGSGGSAGSVPSFG
jgi:hypothetical protein